LARLALPLTIMALAALLVMRSRYRPSAADLVEFSGATMGTSYTVKVHAPGLSEERHAAIGAMVADRLDTVDGLMSTYDSASELSRFNRHASDVAFPISEETLAVFGAAWEISERTDGVFDVTVAPAVDAWGFGPPSDLEPDEAGGRELARRVGYRNITIDADAATLTKARPDVAADLSAIAKGYGVDLVAAGLAALGVGDFLVEVGGEVRASGNRPDGTSWRIGIEAPTPDARTVLRTIELIDMAIATSGDYRNVIERDGVRYTHFIDPSTATPVLERGRSVSVLHPEAMMADGWATALSVLDFEQGMALAEREDIAALFVVQTDSGLTVRGTSAFRVSPGASMVELAN
jgi:thiamine biosynthesis lipoprotein